MTQSITKKKKPIAKTILMGIVSSALYMTLFLMQNIINDYFARGGLYAILLIITAFIFSIIHGSFTSNFWTVLGIEAKKKEK